MAENEATGQQQADQANQANSDQQFVLQRIYLKDMSFESPASPLVFQEKWEPKVKMDLNTQSNKVKDDFYEVVLSLTVTVTNQDKTAYLIEIQQAGIFLVKGLDEPQLRRVLATVCPNILFPYAREAVDNQSVKGSFPPLQLAPVNFDALFAEAVRQQQEKAAGDQSTAAH